MKEYSLGNKMCTGRLYTRQRRTETNSNCTDTTFKYETSEAMGRLFDLEEEGVLLFQITESNE